MLYVKFTGARDEFAAGRKVEHLLRYEDESDPTCIGLVKEPRDGDTELTEQEYQALAATIAAYNAGLPPPDPLPEPPDFPSAMLTAFVALETLAEDTADALLAATPSFGIAMTQQNGPLAWQRLANALTKGKVTQAQFDAIAGALTAHRVPQEPI